MFPPKTQYFAAFFISFITCFALDSMQASANSEGAAYSFNNWSGHVSFALSATGAQAAKRKAKIDCNYKSKEYQDKSEYHIPCFGRAINSREYRCIALVRGGFTDEYRSYRLKRYGKSISGSYNFKVGTGATEAEATSLALSRCADNGNHAGGCRTVHVYCFE